jgi:hypothetical protein
MSFFALTRERSCEILGHFCVVCLEFVAGYKRLDCP